MHYQYSKQKRSNSKEEFKTWLVFGIYLWTKKMCTYLSAKTSPYSLSGVSMVGDYSGHGRLVVKHLVLGHHAEERFCQSVVIHIGCHFPFDGVSLTVMDDVHEGEELAPKCNLSEWTKGYPKKNKWEGRGGGGEDIKKYLLAFYHCK